MRSAWKTAYFWLLLVFCLALLIRLIRLETLPATFFVDEVLSGYLGRFMLINHMDLFGNQYPWLYFNKFGDYYILAPMYLDGLSTFIFGVTRFATRFPTALIGAFAVFPVFGITQIIFSKKSIAFLASILAAFLPWYVVLARATTESIIELTVILGIVWALLFVQAKQQRPGWLTLAFILSLLSYLIYHTARLMLPLIWLGYLAISFTRVRSNRLFLPFVTILTATLLLLTTAIAQTDWGRGRFDQTSIFSDHSGVSIKMTEMTYNLGSNSVLLARIFHNKIVGYTRELVTQYLQYFNPVFLFTDQYWLKTRYGVPQAGPIYLTLLLMIFSLFLPTRSKLKINRSALWLLVWIIIIAPLPAALTVIESPNLRRSVLLGIPLIILAAAGWDRSFGVSWHKFKLGYLWSLFLCLEILFFGFYYVKHSDMYNAIYRSDGQAEIAQYLLDQSSANKYYVTDSIDFPLYYLFAKKDFSASYATQFKPELRIESLGSVVYPRPEICAGDLPADLVTTLSPQDRVIEPERCQYDATRFITESTIYGVNRLIKFRVLAPVKSGQPAGSGELNVDN